MYKEKHIINKTYGNHKLSRYLDVYELNTVDCSADKTTGYKGTEVTLIDDAAWNEKFSAWALTGATATGNNIVLNNDVTAQGIYETAKNVTLQTNGGGTINASPISGFIGDQITLSNTPNASYAFSAYTLTGANLTGSKFNLTGSDVTAKAWFYQPVAKLADTSQYELWVPKRSYSLHPTVENIGVSINSDAYRYVVYSIQYIFYDNGFVLLRPDAQTHWPSIVNHWNIARYNDKIYIAQLSGTNSNFIANVDTWTNGNASVTSYVDGIDGMVAGNYIECTNSQYTNYAKLILDKQESRVSAYVAESDYSNWYTYQGCATVKTTADSTRLEAECTSNENSRVNTHLKVYGCTAFSDATGCYYNK